MRRYVVFSCTSYTTSSYVKISLSWCYATRTSLDFILRCAVKIRPTCFHMSMRGCGAEGADKQCGKVWLPCAINMAQAKFEAAASFEKSIRTPERVIENCICRQPFQWFWHLLQHPFNVNVLKTIIFHHSQQFDMSTNSRYLIGAGGKFLAEGMFSPTSSLLRLHKKRFRARIQPVSCQVHQRFVATSSIAKKCCSLKSKAFKMQSKHSFLRSSHHTGAQTQSNA